MKYKKTHKGFTLVEVLAVLGITVMLMTILITFSQGSRETVVLFNEQSRLISAFTTAKSLSIQTFAEGAVSACGYGVYFPPGDDTQYILFKDEPVGPAIQCVENFLYTGNNQYDAGEEVTTFTLDPLTKVSNTPITSVLFIPPDPVVKFQPPATIMAIIELSNQNDSETRLVRISNTGQITIQ